MLDLIFINPIFWINIIATLVVVVIALIFKKEFHPLEALVQFVATFIILFSIYLIGFETNFELHDREVWNGKIEKFVYYEAWTELVTYTEQEYIGTDSKGNSQYRTVIKTRHDYHGPSWEIDTTIGNFYSSKEDFVKAVKKYGKKFVDISHFDQVSIGDGNKYESYPSDVIPVSKWNDYVNYIRASRFTILKNRGNELNIKDLVSSGKLVPYPEFINGDFNQNYFPRVVNTSGYKIDYKDFEKALSYFCALNSGPKQFNIVVYVTSGVSRDFPDILEEYWKSAHKNDTVLIFNIDESFKIKWSDSISWTQNGSYITETKNLSGGFDSIDNMKILYHEITNNINSNWERIPMKTFEYLKSELHLPLWFQIMVLIVNLTINVVMLFIFLRNNFDKGDSL